MFSAATVYTVPLVPSNHTLPCTIALLAGLLTLQVA